jgi:hypothetical protein
VRRETWTLASTLVACRMSARCTPRNSHEFMCVGSYLNFHRREDEAPVRIRTPLYLRWVRHALRPTTLKMWAPNADWPPPQPTSIRICTSRLPRKRDGPRVDPNALGPLGVHTDLDEQELRVQCIYRRRLLGDQKCEPFERRPMDWCKETTFCNWLIIIYCIVHTHLFVMVMIQVIQEIISPLAVKTSWMCTTDNNNNNCIIMYQKLGLLCLQLKQCRLKERCTEH